MDERFVPLTIKLHPPGAQTKSGYEPKFDEITFYVKKFLILAITIPEMPSVKMCTHMNE